MTRAGVKNQVDSTRLTQDNMDLTKMVPFSRQGPTSVEQSEMEMTKAGGKNNGNRTAMILDNMKMTKVIGGAYIGWAIIAIILIIIIVIIIAS